MYIYAQNLKWFKRNNILLRNMTVVKHYLKSKKLTTLTLNLTSRFKQFKEHFHLPVHGVNYTVVLGIALFASPLHMTGKTVIIFGIVTSILEYEHDR